MLSEGFETEANDDSLRYWLPTLPNLVRHSRRLSAGAGIPVLLTVLDRSSGMPGKH